MSPKNLSIPTPGGPQIVEIKQHKSLFILGRNGTGKSALVHYLRGRCNELVAGRVIYLPGSRPSYFDGDSLQMTAHSRVQFMQNSNSWDSSPDIRIRPVSGTSRNERAIYDLQAAEVQYRVQAAKEIELEGATSPAIARLQSKSSPLDRVNRLLQQANLPIQTIIDSGELKAKRDDSIYSISKMSDGERTALILIADVVSAVPDSVFLVDEPELHLHRAIVVPLLSALLAERPDCTMIISTHELELANNHPDSPIVLVRSCTWNGNAVSAWEINVLENFSNIPEDLRIDILGSRQSILFIEGKPTSRDQPLYATLFPKLSLRHRESCTDVRRAVVGLRQVEEHHHARAYGLVDNDGMDAAFQEKLQSEGVYALPVFAVESLYYAQEVVTAVAVRQAAILGIEADHLVSTAKAKALSTLSQPGKIQHLAARVAERQLRDKILSAIPDRSSMIASGDSPLSINLSSPYPETLLRIQGFLQSGDLYSIISSFPVRESGILGDIAQSLRFISDSDYEKAVLTAINVDSSLSTFIKSKLGALSGCLSN
jgi:ABC-type Mn2+/Zn2+ transport system ATPase subunit